MCSRTVISSHQGKMANERNCFKFEILWKDLNVTFCFWNQQRKMIKKWEKSDEKNSNKNTLKIQRIVKQENKATNATLLKPNSKTTWV